MPCECCGTCENWDGNILKSDAYCKFRPVLPFWMCADSRNGYVGRYDGKDCKTYRKDAEKWQDVADKEEKNIVI